MMYQKLVNLKVLESSKYPCCQIIHDGVTLGNAGKYQAIGLQFIDPNWIENFVLCLGFK